MAAITSTSELIKVLCESCLKNRSAECIICGGSAFYFWDPKTLACFNSKGQLIEIEENDGSKLNVIRHSSTNATDLNLSTLIDFINMWVKQDPVRRWRLSADSDGWHCSICFNRFKKIGVDCSEETLYDSVLSAYNKIRNK